MADWTLGPFLDPNGEWTDAAHWNGGIPSAPGAIANFGFNYSNYEVTLLETANIALGQMNFTATADITFRGSYADSGTDVADLFFDNGGSAAQLSVAGGSTIRFSPLGGLRATLTSNLLVNTAAAGDRAILELGVSGPGKIVKTGDGTLELNDLKTFSGGLDVQGGFVRVSGDSALGSGGIVVSNNAYFIGQGTIDNPIFTLDGVAGAAGSGRIYTASSASMTLTGSLYHLSQSTLTFNYGSIVGGELTAAFGAIFHNPTLSSFAIGNTLKMGNAYNAANLFNYAGTGITSVAWNGRLDTAGFATTVSNLAFDGIQLLGRAVVTSSSGALNLTVNDNSTVAIAQTWGNFTGTAGADSIVVNVLNDFNLTDVNFTTWTAGTDTITYNGSGNANVVIGTPQRETFNGGAGNDTLVGAGGIDVFNGGSGNDLIAVNGSNDGSLVDGGADIDILRVTGGGTVSLGSLANIEAVNLQSGSILVLSAAQFATGLLSTRRFRAPARSSSP